MSSIVNQADLPLPTEQVTPAHEWTLSERIHSEQVKIIIQQFPGIAAGGSVGGCLYISLLWPHVAHQILLSWLAILIFANLAGFTLTYVMYRRKSNPPHDTQKWARIASITGISSGAVWGATGVVFFVPDSFAYQLLVVMWLCTIGGMLTSALVAHRQIYYSALLPLLTPTALRYAVEPEMLQISLAFVTVLYGCMQAFFYQTNHATFMEALRLRFENTDLVQELTQQKDEAERANLAKSRFLAAASHDLRQPLHAQGLFLAELDDYVDHPKGRRILGGLESSTHAMSRLFNALLDISRLDAGVVQANISAFRVNSLLQELEIEFRPQVDELGIKLRVIPCSAIIRSDHALLGSILRNLISNALRYTPNGRVLIGCRRHNNTVTIQIWDTGIGIPPHQLNEIFEEFHQIGNPERDREKGLGLGLAIARRTCRLLSHPLQVTSVPDVGSMFSVTVPVTGPSQLSHVDQQTDAIEYRDLSGAMILVIDDEAAVRQSMRGVLSKWGCQVVDADSSTEATRKLDSSNKPDLIIADYRLRDNHTGLEAIKSIQDRYDFPVPAILITGDTAPERIREANSGGYPLLHKPVKPADLKLALMRCLGKKVGGQAPH